jgi:hypothetical protein
VGLFGHGYEEVQKFLEYLPLSIEIDAF